MDRRHRLDDEKLLRYFMANNDNCIYDYDYYDYAYMLNYCQCKQKCENPSHQLWMRRKVWRARALQKPHIMWHTYAAEWRSNIYDRRVLLQLKIDIRMYLIGTSIGAGCAKRRRLFVCECDCSRQCETKTEMGTRIKNWTEKRERAREIIIIK